MDKSYSGLIRLNSFEERFDYLKLKGNVGNQTFGYDRYLNQLLYRSSKWRKIRDEIIIRDNGCDLGIPGYDILDKIVIHHINPITIEQVEDLDPVIFDCENLICVSHDTHMAIHYQNTSKLPSPLKTRKPGDTTLW